MNGEVGQAYENKKGENGLNGMVKIFKKGGEKERERERKKRQRQLGTEREKERGGMQTPWTGIVSTGWAESCYELEYLGDPLLLRGGQETHKNCASHKNYERGRGKSEGRVMQKERREGQNERVMGIGQSADELNEQRRNRERLIYRLWVFHLSWILHV